MNARTITRRPSWLSKRAWRMTRMLGGHVTPLPKPMKALLVTLGSSRIAVCDLGSVQATIEAMEGQRHAS